MYWGKCIHNNTIVLAYVHSGRLHVYYIIYQINIKHTGPISHPVVKRWLLKPAFKHSLTSVYLSFSISHPVVKHRVNHSLASAGYVQVDW